jgi:hypothetical protein
LGAARIGAVSAAGGKGKEIVTKLKIRSAKEEKQVSQNTGKISLLNVILGAATLIGGVGALVVFLPRVLVASPSAAVDPSNVMSSSFEISNTGYVPLEDMSVKLAAAYISGTAIDGAIPEALKSDGSPNFGIGIGLRNSEHHYLGLDDHFTVNPENNLIGVKTADVVFNVSYRPWIIPMRREKLFRFIAKKDARGNTYWRSWPLNEAAPTD